MGREYRLGIRIVVTSVLLAAGLSFAFLRSDPAPVRAGQELGDHDFPLGSFSLTESSGRTVTDADFANRVWIAAFIFTRCPLSCPRISSVMKGIQDRLADRDVQLVSITVDPEFDTPEILRQYGAKLGADPRWLFLTGARDVIFELIEKRFKLSVEIPSEADRAAGAEAVLHSDRLALVDRGQLVGLFDSNDPEAIKDLIAQADRRARPAWITSLPTVNASLNGLCAVLLVVGWLRIRSRPTASARLIETTPGTVPAVGILDQPHVHQHRVSMIAAVLTSAIFLGCYLVYHSLAGSVAFRGTGFVRPFYFTILISHTLLATFGVVPLVTLTLVRAFQGDFGRHARIARVTFPIWVYVSITGVVIYLMLYQLPVSGSAVGAVG